MELLDLYNHKKEKIGKIIERGTAFKDGEYQLCVGIVIKDEDKYLITKRHPNKLIWPNKWEFTGGTVQSGETSKEAALRELHEETGIKISHKELQYVDCLIYDETHMIMDVYIIKYNVDLDKLVLQADEVVDAKIVTDKDFEALHIKDEITACDWLIYSKLIKKN